MSGPSCDGASVMDHLGKGKLGCGFVSKTDLSERIADEGDIDERIG